LPLCGVGGSVGFFEVNDDENVFVVEGQLAAPA
jgi:hypothetical protein